MTGRIADPKTDPRGALRALLDSYLRCPTQPLLAELDQGLRSYQTDWIRARAGADAPPDAPRPAAARPKFAIAAAERAILERLADGWTATTADVPRWAWFETRELVTLDPAPDGHGPEILRLAPEGWRVLGRSPTEYKDRRSPTE